jgi:hypothetical protein
VICWDAEPGLKVCGFLSAAYSREDLLMSSQRNALPIPGVCNAMSSYLKASVLAQLDCRHAYATTSGMNQDGLEFISSSSHQRQRPQAFAGTEILTIPRSILAT